MTKIIEEVREIEAPVPSSMALEIEVAGGVTVGFNINFEGWRWSENKDLILRLTVTAKRPGNLYAESHEEISPGEGQDVIKVLKSYGREYEDHDG